MMLVANMNIKVETKTDRLKIIDYVLSPLKTKTEESL
ncbi:hemolysin secretion D, plasmid domain protein [Photorhabdus caribbeanensis]|nr:hemolysin secretion D, plasmid domain protein [Photorhabdus caribbeanensis]